jgi:hypothetical protein
VLSVFVQRFWGCSFVREMQLILPTSWKWQQAALLRPTWTKEGGAVATLLVQVRS